MNGRRRVAALAAATLLFVTSLNAAAVTVPVETARDLAERLEIELSFRRDFGLATDVAVLTQLMTNPSAYAGSYGVALTPAELGDLQRRLEIQNQTGPVKEYAEAQPTFAGLWRNQQRGGALSVAFAGDAANHRAEIERLAPAGSVVDVIDVKYSWAELEQTLERVERDRLTLKDQGLWIRELGIDPRPNRVEVAVEQLNDEVVNELHARFGEAIVVEQSGHPTLTGCSNRYDCIGPPVRAGIAAPTNAAVPCSLGFLVHRPGAPYPGVGWLTAGHCAQTIGATWYHAGVAIGDIRRTCWPSCDFSDAALGGWLNSTYSSHRVYRTNISNTRVNLVQGPNGWVLDDQVCLNGRRQPYDQGFRCGLLDEIRRVDYGNVYFWDQGFATFAVYNGDSGGAVHSPLINSRVDAYGIQSGCEDPDGGGCEPGQQNGRGIYSQIANVTGELGTLEGVQITLCRVASPCP